MTAANILSYGDVVADRTVEADIAIIGTGPGGAAAAARLAEAGLRIVMLEAGSHFRPQGFPSKVSGSLPKLYVEEGQLVAASPSGTFIPLTAGKGVGGSPLINSAMCFRGPGVRLDE